jgi:ferric-dicitrate binding protein FerR (iron transport regulator)
VPRQSDFGDFMARHPRHAGAHRHRCSRKQELKGILIISREYHRPRRVGRLLGLLLLLIAVGSLCAQNDLHGCGMAGTANPGSLG